MKAFLLLIVFFPGICIADIQNDDIRLRYDERGLPLVDVQILDRYHTLMLDTGSSAGMHLNQHDLEKLVANPSLDVVQQPSLRLQDITGLENEVYAWKIKNLRISNINFNDVEVVDFKPWGLAMGGGKPVNEVLGLGVFQERLFIMDFKNDRLGILDRLPSGLENWSSYPIEKTKSGLRIKAYMGNTPLYLVVDSGASHSLLFSERLPNDTLYSGCRTIEPRAANLDCRVAKFTLRDKGGRVRDNQAIVIHGVTPEDLDFDGLLGMGFMRGRQVIVDMPGHMLYISRE